ncbi:hypothetical protein [Oceanivirga miroungae]|uniref:Uncharacterized protein n=1 Tax=Oceanivirga miroungae TaxID=1130046 RepID=A0A6I8MED6_9FUSO|nr:hypothetical protein [Oceanivirga miroungae]VWL85452.1 hypothetical protein OMES3154_00737 [Oceanivirga miroungae]
MKRYKIIGLCLLLLVFSIGILYIKKHDNYYLKELEIKSIEDKIREFEYRVEKLKVKKKQIGKDKKYSLTKEEEKILDKNRYSKNEILNLIYKKAVEFDVDVINISKSVLKVSNGKYALFDISLELRSSLYNIERFILSLDNFDKIIDFSSFSLFSKNDSSIINISYIGDNDE